MDKFAGATQYPVRWWGFPNIRSARRIKPTVLLVVHTTGNSNMPSAINEAVYSNRDGSGASFTFVTNRDGTIVQCLDPKTQTPWTNGDINKPNTSIPTVAAMVGSGYSPNEFCLATCENVSYEPSGNPITAAQVETLARLAAWLSKLSGLPIRRSTIIAHGDINSVTRPNCPTAASKREAFLGRIITRAREIAGDTSPDSTEEDPAVIAELKAELAACKATSAKRWQRIMRMEDKIRELNTQIDALLVEIEAAAGATATIAELKIRLRSLRARLATIKATIAAAAADVADD